MLKAFFIGIATYGCETWTLTDTNKKKLNTWWMKQIRKCFGITKKERKRNIELLAFFETQLLSDIVEQRRWNYYGHIYRYPTERWAKFMLTAKLENQKAGRFLNWRKQIEMTKDEAKRLFEERSPVQNFTDDLALDKKSWAKIIKDVQVQRAAPIDIPDDLSVAEGGQSDSDV